MRFNYLITVWLLANVVGSLHAQEINRQQYSINQLLEPGQRPKNYWVVEPPASPGTSSSDEVRIIVRFKSNPSGKADINGRSSAAARVKNEHRQFLSDLQQFENRSSTGRSASGKPVPPSKILFDYNQVFNGFALITTTDIKEEIKNWSYVSSVSEDKKIQLTDLESSQIIRAPAVWSELNITGKGITIGIIDTGIDYSHPDLGGGFGAGFKVKDGYDFVNNDSNPIDDHGHGTHVAGIAAANGPGLKGVAPGASLVAYKVLNAGGSGYDSWILAAIERTVDPDQNPDTQDVLNVVNMSLGRAADESEPLSEAVNNAVAQGVTFVIAAGNSGDYLTVGTPGIAEGAITVAATDRNDNTAYFSSKGPTEKTFILKPDVAAPGTDIYSSFKNGGYEILNGTSMASPHVAGAVALLLEKHPDWTPEVVKAALMNTAKKSFELIWNQGAGRVDVYDAIKADVIVSPGSFSLGIAPQISPYTKTIKAKIYNRSNSTKSFNFSLEGDITSSSFSIAFSPSSFLLNPNSSQDVDITFTINTSTLPIRNLPNAFTGYIVTSTGSKTIKTPVTLVNPQTTKVKFEGELPLNIFVFGVNPGNYFWKPYTPTTSELDLFLPNGTYDIISMFRKNHTVVTEGFTTDANNTITLSKDLAKNRVLFKPLDKFGNAIPITGAAFGTTIFTGIDKNFMTFYSYAEDTFYISDQNSYRYDMKILDKSPFDAEHFYDITTSTENGIKQSKIYSNDPSAFAELNIFNPSAGSNQEQIYYDRAGVGNAYITTWNTYPIPVPNPLKLLLSKHNPDSKYIGTYARLSSPSHESGYAWETSLWKAMSDNHLVFKDKAMQPLADVPSPFDYHLGETLVRYSTQTANRTNKIALLDIRNTGDFNRYYGERESGTVYYKLFAGDDLVGEGNFANSTDRAGGSRQIDAIPQRYKMLLTYEDYQVHGKFGKATVELDFNTSNNDKNTPHLNYLSLDVDGKSTDQFQVGEQATIVTKFGDECFDQITWQGCISTGIASVSMHLKKTGTNSWLNLAVTQTQSGEYNAPLPAHLDAGYYILKLTAKDFSGNILTYQLDPGFLIGPATEFTPYANVNLIEPLNKSINAGTNPLFRWSPLSEADYIIQISDTINFTSNVIEATTNNVVYNLPSPLKKNKIYYWRVKANSPGKSFPWSVIYSFSSSSLQATTLINPTQNASEQPLDIQFKWSKVDNASSYEFRLYYADFSALVYQSYLYDNTLVVNNLLPNTEYFWNVTTNYFTWDNNYYIPSATNHFRTFTLESPTPVLPLQDAHEQPLSVQFKWSKVDKASSYKFQLGTKQDFSELEFQSIIQDTTILIDNLLPDKHYYWNVLSNFEIWNQHYESSSSIRHFKTFTVTGSDDAETRRGIYNYPNPFSIDTNITFETDKPGIANFTIFDPLGQEVNRFNIDHASGINSIHWSGENKKATPLPNGLYIGILETAAGTSRIKMIIKR